MPTSSTYNTNVAVLTVQKHVLLDKLDCRRLSHAVLGPLPC